VSGTTLSGSFTGFFVAAFGFYLAYVLPRLNRLWRDAAA
jgi:hypothetical protein